MKMFSASLALLLAVGLASACPPVFVGQQSTCASSYSIAPQIQVFQPPVAMTAIQMIPQIIQVPQIVQVPQLVQVPVFVPQYFQSFGVSNFGYSNFGMSNLFAQNFNYGGNFVRAQNFGGNFVRAQNSGFNSFDRFNGVEAFNANPFGTQRVVSRQTRGGLTGLLFGNRNVVRVRQNE
jgi:hypothetical protein